MGSHCNTTDHARFIKFLLPIGCLKTRTFNHSTPRRQRLTITLRSMTMELENIVDSGDFRKEAENLLDTKPHLFLDKLRLLIKFGEEKCRQCLQMIQLLVDKGKQNIIEEIKDDQSILHLAAIFHNCHELPIEIVRCCPQVAKIQRTGLFQGQTFLHTLALKGNSSALFDFLDMMTDSKERNDFVQALAVGESFSKTPLMGETLLSVAAIRSDRNMFLTLLDYGAALTDQNSKGDTVLHSLIRYANAHPDKLQPVMNTLQCCHEDMIDAPNGDGNNWGKRYAKTVWFTENKAQQTPLQLAAHLGEYEIFEWIMNLQWVYRVLHDCDSLFDFNKYDVTELDTAAKLNWIKDKQQDMTSTTSSTGQWNRVFSFDNCYKDACLMRQTSPSIIETMCELDFNKACKFISLTVIRRVVDCKWKKYRRSIIIWALIHLLFVMTLTVYAHYKVLYLDLLTKYNYVSTSETTVIKTTGNLSNNSSNNVSMASEFNTTATTTTQRNVVDFNKTTCLITSTQENFVTAGSCILLITGILILYLEFVRTFVQQKPWQLSNDHHNGRYRLILVLLGLSLVLDSIWFLVSPETNHKLPIILAVLLGWWFTIFFFRPIKLFSFYTVMLQRVLGDMLRFSVFIALEMISFTVAIRLLLLQNQPIPDEFRDLGASVLTMFRLMLGLSDLEVLEMASPYWLAVVLFILFAMITCVLLLNSLIAMMSSTCSEISLAKDQVWQIQRLSVILFMEHMFMTLRHVRPIGEKNYVLKFKNEQDHRYFLDTSTSQTSTIDCRAIVRAKHYIRRIKFDENYVRNRNMFSHQSQPMKSSVYFSAREPPGCASMRSSAFRQA